MQRKLDAQTSAIAAGAQPEREPSGPNALSDALHALSCAAGYNIRWLLRVIVRLGVAGLFCALNFAGLCLAIRLIQARLAAQLAHGLATTRCISSAALSPNIHAAGG